MTLQTARLALFMAVCLLVPALTVLPGKPAMAQAPAQLSEEDNAAVALLNTYLNEIVNMKGEFTQTSPRGQIANGVFYISKPGKMRFEYAPPSPLLVVSDGRWVTVKNSTRQKPISIRWRRHRSNWYWLARSTCLNRPLSSKSNPRMIWSP